MKIEYNHEYINGEEIVYRNIPEAYDVYAENFPYCHARCKKMYDWWKANSELEDKRIIYLSKWFFTYERVFIEIVRDFEGVEYLQHKELLEFYLHTFSPIERHLSFQIFTLNIKNSISYSPEQAKKVESLIPVLEKHFQEEILPPEKNIKATEAINIYNQWLKILPFENNHEAVAFARSLYPKQEIGDGDYNRFIGKWYKVYSKDRFIKFLKNWGSSMLKYYCEKLKSEQPEIRYRELREQEHIARQNKIYQKLGDHSRILIEWQNNVAQWLANEKEYYDELRKDFVIDTFDAKENQTKYNWQLLSNQLIKEGFIAKETLPRALASFFRKEKVSPKITWIDRAKNHSYTKHTLFTLIKIIDSHSLDIESKSLLYQRISDSFIDGNKINYSNDKLKASLHNWITRINKKGYNTREIRLISIIQSHIITS